MNLTGGKAMEYTVKALAKLAGISSRTLRYYDEIGLLHPARINSSGYRIYSQFEVDMLQQILFYKELGFELSGIKSIVYQTNFDGVIALKEHHEKLLEKKSQLEKLIENVSKTINAKEGRVKMQDKEKFEGFKKEMIDKNEKLYGKELRNKYSEDKINKSNEKLSKMTQEEYEEVTRLNDEIMKTLKEAFKLGNPSSVLAQKAAELHKKWIGYYWDEYSSEAHARLAQMYVDDERFRIYYDKDQNGIAEFLKDAILIYTKK